MATINNNVTRNNQQRKNLEESVTTLNQLISRPDITVKKKVLLKNFEKVQKNNNTPTKVNSQTKVTILPTKVNSQAKVTNLPTKVTDSPTKVTNLPTKVTDSGTKDINLKNDTVVKQKNEQSKHMAEKLMFLQNVEFYPDRGKRNVRAKKIKLQPKHDYKVVATTNKRKRGTPHRGVHPVPNVESSLQPTGPLSTKTTKSLSLSSMLQLAEQQGLNDEDFMEILTCPSPVWWEDSDEDYASFDDGCDWKTENNQNTHGTEKKVSIDSNGNKIPIENNSLQNFFTKRSKLESILGKIKYKNSYNSKESNDIENINNEENILYIDGHLSNTEYNIRNDGEEEDNCLEDENNVEESTVINFRNRTRNTSIGGLSDVSINEDELLYTLQSIELPVRNINEEQGAANETTNDIILMDLENNETGIKLNSNEKKSIKESKNKRVKQMVKTKQKIAINKLTNDLNIPTELPIFNVPKAYESPISIGSPNSDRASVTEMDSISDTNIKFLDEYVDEKKESEAPNIKKYSEGKELVTVYQIMTNQPATDLDVENQIKVNLVDKSPQSYSNAVHNSTKSNTDIFNIPSKTDVNSKNNEIYTNRKRRIIELRKGKYKNRVKYITMKNVKKNNVPCKNEAIG